MRFTLAALLITVIAHGAFAQDTSRGPHQGARSNLGVAVAPDPDHRLWFEKTIDDILTGHANGKAGADGDGR